MRASKAAILATSNINVSNLFKAECFIEVSYTVQKYTILPI